MSTTFDAEELRPLLRKQLDGLPDSELHSVQKALSEIETRYFRRSIGAAADAAIDMLKPGEIEAAVRDHRTRQPYR